MPILDIHQIDITQKGGDKFMTAQEGSFDGKVLKIPKHQHCKLTNVGAPKLIGSAFIVKGLAFAAEAQQIGGLPRPNNRVTEKWNKTMKLKSYSATGACQYEIS
jgi:hypothetical protein